MRLRGIVERASSGERLFVEWNATASQYCDRPYTHVMNIIWEGREEEDVRDLERLS